MKSKCALIALILQATTLMSATAQWTGTGTPLPVADVWLTDSSWNPMTHPSLPGDIANLTLPTATNLTMRLTSVAGAVVISLQQLTFDNATGYTINPGPGPGSFNFSGGPAAINVTTANGNSTNAINAIVTLSNALTISQNSTFPLTFNGAITGAAAQPITIAGTGTVVFAVPNPGYSGKITISAGTLSITDDNGLGSAGIALTIGNGTLLSTASTSLSRAVSLTGTAGIQAALGFTSTVNTVISGAGSLNIANSGTVFLGGANTYQGGTTITTGILSISSDGNLGNTSGALNIGNGTLSTTADMSSNRSGTFSGTATINPGVFTLTLNGNFGGAGSLAILGAGTVDLLGTNSYVGGTTVGSGAQLNGTTNGLQGNIGLTDGTSRLTFSQNFDGTYAGVINGAGSLTKLGSGEVTFSGASPTFNGTTHINQGTLNVNGSIANSAVTVNPNTTLSGSGTVGATTNSGTIQPGNRSSVGTLHINGPLVLVPLMSHVLIDLAPITSNNIAVNGTATINGALTISPTPGFYGFIADYTILTSTGLLGGMFAPVISTNPAFAPIVTYTSTNVLLHVVISEPFAVFPFSNANTAAVGNNFDDLHAANQLSPDLFNIINTFIGQSFTTINDALDQMHPAQYSAFTELQAEMDGQLLSLFHRLPYLPCACSNPNRMWVEPFGNSMTLKRHGLEIGAQANSGGLAFGYDGQILENFVLGFGGAWNTSHLDWHDHRGHGDVSGLYGAIYFDSQIGDFYLGGSFLAGVDFYDTHRHIKFLTTNRHTSAEYQATDVMGQIATAYLFGSPQVFFYPYANLDYLYLHTHKIDESKADGLNLKVEAHTDATLRTEMGLGLQVQDTNAAQTMCISPLVSIGWVNMTPLERPMLKSTFAGATIPFSVRGWDETWNLFNANFGLAITYRCYSLDLQYNAEMSTDKKTLLFNQRGGIRFDWKW